MAAVESTEAPAATSTKQRPVKPDQATFEAGLEALEKELKAKSDKQDYYVNQLKLLSPDSAQSEKQQELRGQLTAIRQRQTEIRAANQKVFEEIRTLDDGIKRKIKEVQSAKSKISFKSIDELDAHIKKLEAAVDSGTMKLVDEKRTLSDITGLKKARKSFSNIREIEQSIAESKEKVAALRSKTEDSESKELSSKHQKIQSELDAIRAEIDKVQKNRSTLVEQRNEARKAREEAYNALRKFKNDFYQQKKEYGKYEQEERQRRWERKKAEREAFERERRKKRAAQKLEAASEPAFGADIAQAESLLQYFEPTFKPTSGALRLSSSLAAQATRTIDAAPPAGTQILTKKTNDETYFVGKKGKKNKNTNGISAAEKEKFTLNFEIVSQLSKLSLGVPMNKEEVPATVEALKSKVQWFKDNQDRVTTENIKKAEVEIERLEKDAEAEAAKDQEPRKRPVKQNGSGTENDEKVNGETDATPDAESETAADETEDAPVEESAETEEKAEE
ncbi:hypothetical protein V1515DRAFT_640049 [Lipomyces mesembrius]